MLVIWLNRLHRIASYVSKPLVTIEDEESHQRATTQALLLLSGALLLLTIIPFTIFVGVPGTTSTTRILTDIACVFVFLTGYTLSRYNMIQLAINWMIFPASAVIAALSITIASFGFIVLFFLGIPIVISGLFATMRITAILVTLDTIFMLASNLVFGLFSFDLLISPIIFNIVIAFFTVGAVEYRKSLINRYNLRLRQSEARYRALVESVKDILFTLTTDGTITSLNPAVTEISGWQLDELVGKNFLSVFHPDDAVLVFNTFGRILQKERPHRVEARVLTKSGGYRWVELSASTIDVEGLHGMSGVARDINTRKLTEAALHESRLRLSLLIEQMPLALVEWDTLGNIVAWNPAATHIFGFTMEEAFQMTGFDFIVPEVDKQPLRTFLNEMIHSKTFALRTNINVTKDGRMITCDWVNIPLVDGAGQVIGIAAMAQDITERLTSQQQQMKLMLTQERLSVLQSFLSSISHDFRTSFAQIETSRYLIERSVSSEDKGKIQSRLDNIGFSIQHLVSQLENLNMISSLGELNLHPHQINLMMERIITGRQPAAIAKKLQIQRLFASDLPPIMCDADKLQTAITHLLANAITYTPEGGVITITTRKLEKHIAISVADTGQGILKEDQEHIFDLFYRVDKARSLQTGGIGIGLSVSRMIVESHGGSLNVVSERDKGSTFTLMLPLVNEAELTA